MGRNRFEKQLKEQMQVREIRPSEGAWDRISRQLEASQTTNSGNFQWWGIAAGFTGIIFVSVLYLTMNGLSADAETQISDDNKNSIPFNSVPKSIQEQNIGEDTFIVDSKIQDKKSIQSKIKRNTNTTKKEILISSKEKQQKVEKTAISLKTSESLIDTKIAGIVAQVALLEKRHNTVTDAEIDSLLRRAQRQLLEDKIFRNNRSVDPMALLADVEDELDQSFRDQIFNVLKDGFLKVRTAVADRNK